MKLKQNSKSVVTVFSVDRRIKRALDKKAAAGGMTPSALVRFFLAKRCNAPS